MGVKKKIFMVVGCPGSGKSWVCEKLSGKFQYVRHDDNPKGYVPEIVRQAKTATKPLLIETPFSVSQIKEPLEKQGFEVVPLYIQERPEVIRERYQKREGKPIPEGHLTRQQTYRQRAAEQGAFSGSSTEILQRLSQTQTERFPWET
jgi:predicted kinase